MLTIKTNLLKIEQAPVNKGTFIGTGGTLGYAMHVLTPGDQQAFGQCKAVVGDGAVLSERGSKTVPNDGHPQRRRQREEMHECCDDDARVDTAQLVSVVGEQQAQVVGQRRPRHLNHCLTERVSVQRPTNATFLCVSLLAAIYCSTAFLHTALI